MTAVTAEAVSLLALPHIDPGRGRVRLDVAPGTTVAEMVAQALPGLTEPNLAFVRVTIGPHVIKPAVWHLVRPLPATQVVVRVIPGKGNLRTLLTIVVAVAAIAAGQFYAPFLAGQLGFAAGSFGAGAIKAGVMLATPPVGSVCLDALRVGP